MKKSTQEAMENKLLAADIEIKRQHAKLLKAMTDLEKTKDKHLRASIPEGYPPEDTQTAGSHSVNRKARDLYAEVRLAEIKDTLCCAVRNAAVCTNITCFECPLNKANP